MDKRKTAWSDIDRPPWSPEVDPRFATNDRVSAGAPGEDPFGRDSCVVWIATGTPRARSGWPMGARGHSDAAVGTLGRASR